MHVILAVPMLADNLQSLSDKVTLDSQILGESFYFFTVVAMWLIHVGFMAYEAGVARRKNVMSTAMKNILTIAVVTPTFYYFGWWIYGCIEAGLIPQGPDSTQVRFVQFCSDHATRGRRHFGPNLNDHISARLLGAPSCCSPGRPVRSSPAPSSSAHALSAYLVLTVLLGSVVWILDAAWGWSAGGWLTTGFGFHDSIASSVVHGVAGAFTLGVLFNLGPRIGKFDAAGLAQNIQTPQSASHTDGADADLHRLLCASMPPAW